MSARTAVVGPLARRSVLSLIAWSLCCVSTLLHTAGSEFLAKDQYRRFALLHEGDPVRGQELFHDTQRLGCARCHTVDGTAREAGPDLFAIGDKFGRREIIEAVLLPSESIAVGYSSTTIETKSGDEYTGIIKEVTDSAVALMAADAVLVRVDNAAIEERRTSEISLMPEGLQNSLTLQEFTDVIEYLVSLKQPENASTLHQGMPNPIPLLDQPVVLVPFHPPDLAFEHLVWFGHIPGAAAGFAVVEHESGRIWRLDAPLAAAHDATPASSIRTTSSDWRKSPFLDTGRYAKGTRGLLGMAFHPGFASNRKYYIAKHIVENGRFATLILEYEASPDGSADSGKAPRLLLRFDAATNVHYGGGLAFGPDGYLYIGMGDTGPQEDPQGHGQETNLLLGKMLRIDVDHCDGERPYRIPADNPFVGRAGFQPEIWAYGFREPWRFSFDSRARDLWVGDVGQDRYEEIDIVRRGDNCGWNVYEGFEPFSNRSRREGETFVAPVFAYGRKYGPSVTGGYVYRRDPGSSFYGVYICGDYESRRIFGLTQQGRILQTARQIGTSPQRIVSFAEDLKGDLFLVGYEGTIYRIDFSRAVFR